jgi:hypothetical protein
MNDQQKEYSEWDREAAKWIACAVMSYQAVVTYESLWAQDADQKEEPEPINGIAGLNHVQSTIGIVVHGCGIH